MQVKSFLYLKIYCFIIAGISFVLAVSFFFYCFLSQFFQLIFFSVNKFIYKKYQQRNNFGGGDCEHELFTETIDNQTVFISRNSPRENEE